MRLCIPVTQHFGLGNEMMAIGKAFCAAQECGLRLVHPQWARADRKYHYERYFPAPWRDRLLRRYGRFQRNITFAESDYLASGVTDYGLAAHAFLEPKGLMTGSLSFYAEGMWGGFKSIENSRTYIRSLLLQMPVTLSNYYAVAREFDPAKLTVAVHVRLGDFAPPSRPEWKPGTWNTRLPLEWYESVCNAVAAAFGPRVQFLLCTDGTAQECDRLIRRFQPIHTLGQSLNACSDLLLMADADLLICSISSFSFWAAFLSDRPYVLYAPALQRERDCAFLWERPADPVSAPAGWQRGVAMDRDARLPEALATAMERRLAEKAARSRDLILGGCIPRSGAMSLLPATGLILLTWLALGVIFTGLGLLVWRLLKRRATSAEELFDAFWIGYAATIVLLTIAHFFLPIGGGMLLLTAALGLTGCVLTRGQLAGVLKAPIPGGWKVSLLMIVAAVWLSNAAMGAPMMADSAGYHLQAIRWTSSQRVTPGLGNVIIQLGYNNSSFLYLAMLDVGPWRHGVGHIGNGLLLLAVICRLLVGIARGAGGKRARVEGVYCAVMLWAAVIAARKPDVCNLNPNFVAFCLGIILGLWLLEHFLSEEDEERRRRLVALSFLAAVGITVKLSFLFLGGMMILIAGYVEWRKRRAGREWLKPFATLGLAPAAVALAPWLVHGAILSGYLLFPSTAMPLPVDWRVPAEDARVAVSTISSWARWIGPMTPGATGSWDWFPWWRSEVWRHFEVGPPLAILIAALTAYLFLRRDRSSGHAGMWLYFVAPVASVIFWFFTAPAPSFAGAVFWIMAAGAAGMVFGPLLDRIAGRINGRWLFVATVALGLYFFVSGKGECLRLLRSEHNLGRAVAALGANSDFVLGHEFYMRPQPTPKPCLRRYVTESGLELNIPEDGWDSWESPLPCVHVEKPRLALRQPGSLEHGFRIMGAGAP